jgi:hypothetical protein
MAMAKRRQFQIIVTNDGDNKVSLASVQVAEYAETDFILRESSGSASREPSDKYNQVVGDYLAVGRALETMGKKLQKAGWGHLAHDENMRKNKAKAKENGKKTTIRAKTNGRKNGTKPKASTKK